MPDLLLSADWTLPVSQPAIENGAVLVRDGRVAATGPRDELAARHPGAIAEHFAGCVICPGLVNAHTHLTLTALAGVLPPLPFAEWLPRLVTALAPWEIADHEASGVVGAEESLRAGVTSVGDIAYGAAEVARAAEAGLGGIFYWELLGIAPGEIDARLAGLGFPADPHAYGERAVCGLSAHSPYTSGPALLSAVHERAAELGVPTAIHVSESEAEVRLLRDGYGPLAATAARMAKGFTPPQTTTTRYLHDLGALAGITAVHVCHATADDFELLARFARGVVTCPRSNRYLGNPVPRLRPLLDAGTAVGAGTDSTASNHDLDLMNEVRALTAEQPDLTPEELVRIATLGGAAAIGAAERSGSLESGHPADLAVFAVGATGDPFAALVDRAGAETVRAVMSAGVWRVRDGAFLSADGTAGRRAADARRRSLAALEAR